MSKFYRLGDNAINFDNINYVQKIAHKDETYLDIHFVGTDQRLSINVSNPEGKALLHWWNNMISALPDGTEEVQYVKLNW